MRGIRIFTVSVSLLMLAQGAWAQTFEERYDSSVIRDTEKAGTPKEPPAVAVRLSSFNHVIKGKDRNEKSFEFKASAHYYDKTSSHKYKNDIYSINAASHLYSCFDSQRKALLDVLRDPNALRFLRTQDITEIKLEFIDNISPSRSSFPLAKDDELTYGLEIYSDPVLKVTAVYNSKKECKMLSKEQILESLKKHEERYQRALAAKLAAEAEYDRRVAASQNLKKTVDEDIAETKKAVEEFYRPSPGVGYNPADASTYK